MCWASTRMTSIYCCMRLGDRQFLKLRYCQKPNTVDVKPDLLIVSKNKYLEKLKALQYHELCQCNTNFITNYSTVDVSLSLKDTQVLVSNHISQKYSPLPLPYLRNARSLKAAPVQTQGGKKKGETSTPFSKF